MGRYLEEREPRYHIQFRLGGALIKKIREHAKANKNFKSKNDWMLSAIHEYLHRGYPLKLKISAQELINNKVTEIIRLDPETLKEVNFICTEKEMNRTTWLIDACLSKIVKDTKSKRKKSKI